MAAFSSRFRVIAYDSVNHGHSTNSPLGQPEPDRADELDGFLAALGIERPVLAANSIGALTLLRWAVRQPERALDVHLGCRRSLRTNRFARAGQIGLSSIQL